MSRNKIMNIWPGQDRVKQDSSGGVRLQLDGATVANIHIDRELRLDLSDGSKIQITRGFQLSVGDSVRYLDLYTSHGQDLSAQLLLSRIITRASVEIGGILNISLDLAGMTPLKLVVGPSEWLVYFAEGIGCVAMPDGTVELLPPQDPHPTHLE